MLPRDAARSPSWSTGEPAGASPRVPSAWRRGRLRIAVCGSSWAVAGRRGGRCGMPDGAVRESRLRFHYAWVIAAVTFLVLIVTAGVRATPGVLMVPLEAEFGWSRAAISAAVAINIALFGLIGPFAASAMNRWGMRR